MKYSVGYPGTRTENTNFNPFKIFHLVGRWNGWTERKYEKKMVLCMVGFLVEECISSLCGYVWGQWLLVVVMQWMLYYRFILNFILIITFISHMKYILQTLTETYTSVNCIPLYFSRFSHSDWSNACTVLYDMYQSHLIASVTKMINLFLRLLFMKHMWRSKNIWHENFKFFHV